MKALSVIGVIGFTFTILVCASTMYDDPTGGSAWGLMAACYGLALSIVGLVKSGKVAQTA
jgi:hypothetical protein